MSNTHSNSGYAFLLAVDKPAGPTSHDVVDRVRRALGERRVGHAGTLDPDASGVMVIGVGVATRLLTFLSADRKSYLARIAFGFETTTDDAAGEATVIMPIPPQLTNTDFATQTIASLVGVHEQVPPAYSAAHVNGRRAYAVARSGRVPTLAPRTIEIFSANLLSIDEGSNGTLQWTCAFEVSKGTYIRSVARDLGRHLQTAAHLAELRRSASGGVSAARCLTPDEIDQLGVEGVCNRSLDPLVALNIARRDLDASELADVVHGRRITHGVVRDQNGIREPHDGERLGMVKDGLLHGIWECHSAGLSCVCNLPGGVLGVQG